jgi:putative ABC transport system permease protein
MILLFFKTALRNLTKRKGYSALNIFGLTLGMTCCLLIFKYVAYERSYDRFQKNASQIFRVQLDDYQNGQLAVKEASNYAALSPALKQEFPDIEESTHFFKTHMLLSNEERNIHFHEDKIYYAEPSFLSLFDVQLVEGDAQTALAGPDKIVLTEDMAAKYFGHDKALGKIISWRSKGRIASLLVTGICKKYPVNSHLNFMGLVSYKSFSEVNGTLADKDDPVETSWYWTDFYTYIRLRPGANAKKLEAALPAFADRHVNQLSDNLANHDHSVFQMIPMPDIHLYSHYAEETEPPGDGKSVAFLFLIGFIILGIAWINYINMATARSMERAREVGVRKLLGAVRRDLISQFMMESLLINGMALLLAVFVSYLLMNPFQAITGKQLGSLFELPPAYILAFGLLFFIGSFISGIYPAFVLSAYHPVTVLKGIFKNSGKGLWLRKGLIIGQFAVSILLISGTIIIYKQVQFMRNQNPGADIKRTIVIQGAASIPDSVFLVVYEPFKNEMLHIPGVKHMTSSSNVLGQEVLWASNWKALHVTSRGAGNIFQMAIDYDFIPDFDLKLKAGRNFSREYGADKKSAILNEKAVRAFGFHSAEEALHQTIISNNDDTLMVAGVVADFHQEGLQKEITPMVMYMTPRTRSAFSIKLDSGQSSAVIASVKKLWGRYFPSDPFNYFFLDDFFNRQYDEDRRFGDVFGIFSLVAVVIACLGLLALSAYNVLQRTKEIGIRKVLGASVQDLVLTLSKDFLFLVMIAFVIAIPISVWVMGHWLQSFAYRIQISWWIYVLAGVISILIAIITLSFQAIKAAVANPINSLRAE